jgi:ubiquinone/menaquinone biosynthesis C-methylase UbiE
MNNEAESKVSRFYNSDGWVVEDGVTKDAELWEDTREYARKYVSNCRLRVLRHIPNEGKNILDMASGPIQYKEYLLYSKNFQKRYCVDLSANALADAQKKIGDHGVFLNGSFFDIPLEENFFDCTLSLHTIYHMDKEKQAEAVRKLIKVTKPNKKIIIVYSNPNTLHGIFYNFVKKIVFALGKKRKPENSYLYFHAYPIKWWDQFNDYGKVEIFPWRSLPAQYQKLLFPNNKLGQWMFDCLFGLEEKFPRFFVKHFQYPMIVITKK